MDPNQLQRPIAINRKDKQGLTLPSKYEDLYPFLSEEELNDSLNEKWRKEIYGLIQESYAPIGLHVDGGFELESQIYKQSLIPLSSVGSTVIFKNRFYGGSTSFTKDPDELKKKDLKYGQNKRSSEHLNLYGDKPFDKKIHKNY